MALGSLSFLFGVAFCSAIFLVLPMRIRKLEPPPEGRPKLRLTFAATIESSREAWGQPTPLAAKALAANQLSLAAKASSGNQVSQMRVAVDSERLVISMQSAGAASEGGAGTVLRFRDGKRDVIMPFFSKTVCYAFSLGGADVSPDTLFSEVLQHEVLGVPLALYEAAVPGGSGVAADGHRCQIMVANNSMDLGDDMSFRVGASLCVGADGELFASNVTQEIVEGEHKSLHGQTVHTLFSHYDYRPRSPAAFDTRARTGEGRCVDLGDPGVETGDMKLNDADRLRRINTEAKGIWTAAAYDFWEDRRALPEETAMSLGLASLAAPRLPLRHSFSSAPRVQQVPESFDARVQWKNCPSLRLIRNQGECGGCWAFSAASVLQDRFCIASNGTDVLLSVEQLLDCGMQSDGCQGGLLDQAWQFLKRTGIPLEACNPYHHCPDPSKHDCGRAGKQWQKALPLEFRREKESQPQPWSEASCAASCSDGEPVQPYKAVSAYAVSLPGDVAAMQLELLSHGPLQVGYFIFSDFFNYKSGTYFRTPSAAGPFGGHAVKLLGWGIDGADVPYWLVANSWSPQWGLDGFFRIRRGTNECGIETTPAAGLPDLVIA